MRVLGPLLLAALLALGAMAGWAWQRAGRERAQGLEAQALGMAEVLRAAAEEGLRSLEVAEAGLVGRLTAAGRRAAAGLDPASPLGEHAARDLLEQVAREEQVGRLAWVDGEGALRALVRGEAALPPATATAAALRAQAEALEREELLAAARALAPPPGETRREGLTQNRFASRERFGVALGLAGGGLLLLRADADAWGALRRRLGVEPVLARVAAQPGVRDARVVDAAGRALLAPGTGAAPPPLTRLPDAPQALAAPQGVRAVAPFTLPDGTRAAVDLTLDRAPAEREVAAARRALLLGGALALLALLGAALGMAHVERRRRASEAAARARSEEERRLVEMGALAGLATHELANPLNSVRLGLPLLAGDLPPAQRAQVAGTVAEEAARMGRTLEAFLGLARRPAGAPERLDARGTARLLARVAERAGPEAARRGVPVVVDAAAALPSVDAEPLLLEQALTNLVRNALQAAPPGSRVELCASADEGGGLCLRVDDAGPGLPAQGREALLTVGAAGRPGGHGLGLALAARFVRQHGGSLRLLDRPGGGARVEAHLPAAPSPVAPSRSPA